MCASVSASKKGHKPVFNFSFILSRFHIIQVVPLTSLFRYCCFSLYSKHYAMVVLVSRPISLTNKLSYVPRIVDQYINIFALNLYQNVIIQLCSVNVSTV